MLEQKLREAITNNDWDTAQKIEALIKSQQEQQLAIEKWEFEKSMMRVNIKKSIVEIKKIEREHHFSVTTVFATVSGMVIAIATFIKSLFNK